MPNAIPNFFTRSHKARFTVPHPPLGERWMLVIHAAVTAAFVIIRRRGFNLGSAEENAITNKLEDVLMNDLLDRGQVEGFDKLFFGRVTRGSEVENYNGEKISKKPDLVFHLQRENTLWDRRQDAIFAECKPVDKEHSLPVNYCAIGSARAGVERFVIGDYAWAMQEAIIIGYVRGGYQIIPHLENSLKDLKRHKSLGSPTAPVAVLCGPENLKPLFFTCHQRSFTWKQNGKAACSISLYHSWHDCE